MDRCRLFKTRKHGSVRPGAIQPVIRHAVYGYASRQGGSATVEYTLVSLAVIAALFIPLGGEGSLSGVGLLLQGLRNFQMHTTYLLSLP